MKVLENDTCIHIFYFVGEEEHADSHKQIFKFYYVFIDTGNSI